MTMNNICNNRSYENLVSCSVIYNGHFPGSGKKCLPMQSNILAIACLKACPLYHWEHLHLSESVGVRYFHQ